MTWKTTTPPAHLERFIPADAWKRMQRLSMDLNTSPGTLAGGNKARTCPVEDVASKAMAAINERPAPLPGVTITDQEGRR